MVKANKMQKWWSEWKVTDSEVGPIEADKQVRQLMGLLICIGVVAGAFGMGFAIVFGLGCVITGFLSGHWWEKKHKKALLAGGSVAER